MLANAVHFENQALTVLYQVNFNQITATLNCAEGLTFIPPVPVPFLACTLGLVKILKSFISL